MQSVKIVLLCTAVEQIAEERFQCFFRPLGGREDALPACSALMAYAPLVGQKYNVLLRGLFPSEDGPHCPCVCDAVEIETRGRLLGIDIIQTELKALETQTSAPAQQEDVPLSVDPDDYPLF